MMIDIFRYHIATTRYQNCYDKASKLQDLGTVDSGYKGMLNRGNSGYRGQFAADQNFYLIKTG